MEVWVLQPKPGTGAFPITGMSPLRPVLCSRHRSGCPDRQLQRPTQSGQIGVAGTTVVGFPKIDARCTDADLFGNVGD